MKCGKNLLEKGLIIKQKEGQYPAMTAYQSEMCCKAIIILDQAPEEEQEVTVSVQVLKESQAKIKGSFATLVRKVTAKLEKKHFNIDEFRLYIFNLFPPGDIIANSATVTDIFGTLSRHRLWDYSYCTPIEEIANEFGGDDLELRGWISYYKSELAGFKATTRIVDYIKMCSGEEEIADAEQSLRQDMARYDRQYCRKLTVKLKSRVTEKSLDFIDQFWRSIADHFLFPSLPVLLDSIQEGCVEVTWLVPTLSALQIQTNIQDSAAFLEECEVMQVIMDGEILYDEEGLGTKLLGACRRGEVDEAIALLTYGVDVDTTCTEERTPLLTAADGGHLEMVELLFSYHATVDKGDCDGYTPLIIASRNGHLDMVQLLLAHNADTDIMTKDGHTALSVACFKGHFDIATVLLHHGALPDIPERWTPLMYVIDSKEEHLSMVKLLLDAGAFINNNLGTVCPLSLACENGYINIVNMLIVRGANVNVCLKGDGITPLMMASSGGRLKVVNVLLEYGADVHARCKDGTTAMHYCCEGGHLDIVKVLESHGATLDAATETGYTPLISACIEGHTSVVHYLLEKKPLLLNMQSQSGCTPLIFACTKNSVDIVQYLLEKKSLLLNMQSKTGWSPLMLASARGHSALVAELLSHGADVELHTYRSGFSALMLSANKGHLEVVKMLLKAGAPVNYQTDSTGWTALFLAAKNGYSAIAKVLLEYGADPLSKTKTAAEMTAYDAASIHGHSDVCEELEAHGYQSLAPPTEDMRREVEHSSKVLTQNFLDMENIRTFREVLRNEGRGAEVKQLPSNHSPLESEHAAS